jgi:uncharacterized membrane protein
MDTLLSFTLLASEGSSGIAASTESIVASAMQLALPLLKAIGVAIIIWGVVCATVRLVGMEIKLLRGQQYKRDAAAIRQHLGFYLLLGLEFLIAVDVIETLMHPDWKELGILAGLVVLRTLMSFSLHWELKEIEKDQQNEQQVAGASSSSGNS